MGGLRIMGFEGVSGDGKKEEAVALVMGDIHDARPWCAFIPNALPGTYLDRCAATCRQQLEMALAMIAETGRGCPGL